MQVSTRSAQWGLGSDLVDWYPDATCGLYGHLLTELLPRRGDRLRFYSNTWPIPSNFYILERLKHLKSLEDDQSKFLFSPTVPIVSVRMENSFPSVSPKSFHQVSPRRLSKSAWRKTAEHRKTTVDKFSERALIIFSEKHVLEKKKRCSGIRIFSTAQKCFYSSVIDQLLRHGTVCSRPASVYIKTLNTHSVSMQELPKYQALQNSAYQIVSNKKEINEKLFVKADYRADIVLSFPRIKRSILHNSFLDGVETGVLLPDFAHQLIRRNADV